MILSKLQHLVFENYFYEDISTYCVFQILQNFPLEKLKILNLNDCNITHIVNFKSIISNCSNIEELILDYLNINDDFVVYVLENCEKLNFISLNGCKQLTDLSFTKLRKQNKSLITLSIDHCPNLTADLSLNVISKIFLKNLHKK
jgi:hypothetical protein